MHTYRRFTQIMYVLLVILTIWLIAPVMAGGGNPDAAKRAWPMIERGALLVDVRTQKEFAEGHLDGAINIPYTEIDALVAAIGDDKQREVVLYCRSGNRVGKSINALNNRGYTDIFNATGLEALMATKPQSVSR